MAFSPARPLAHHTNLQLTHEAADAIECSFHLVLRAALELEFNFNHPTCSCRDKTALILEVDVRNKDACSQAHTHTMIRCKVFTSHKLCLNTHTHTHRYANTALSHCWIDSFIMTSVSVSGENKEVDCI